MHISRQLEAVRRSNPPYMEFRQRYFEKWSARARRPESADFVFGNPNEMPIPGFGEALARASLPQNKDWFAYKIGDPASKSIVAATLRERTGLAWEPDDIFLTNGGIGALASLFRAILDPGDQVILITPSFFFYEPLIAAAGGEVVRVKSTPDRFDLDLPAIEAAIGPRTRALLLNSPHNPTGRIYGAEALRALATILERHSLPLISDEAFNRIIFDGRTFVSPTTFYANSILAYTYSKTLLTPGQRLGYLALPPGNPHRAILRAAIPLAQTVTGFAFPNAVLLHALPELEKLSIDVRALQRRRDRLAEALQKMGYQLNVPEGTYYVLVKSPWPDDDRFAELLTGHGVFVLPASVMHYPGYFRLSLTVTDETIERALPGFERALAEARLKG